MVRSKSYKGTAGAFLPRLIGAWENYALRREPPFALCCEVPGTYSDLGARRAALASTRAFISGQQTLLAAVRAESSLRLHCYRNPGIIAVAPSTMPTARQDEKRVSPNSGVGIGDGLCDLRLRGGHGAHGLGLSPVPLPGVRDRRRADGLARSSMSVPGASACAGSFHEIGSGRDRCPQASTLGSKNSVHGKGSQIAQHGPQQACLGEA